MWLLVIAASVAVIASGTVPLPGLDRQAAATSYADLVMASEPMSYWRFNGNASAVHDSSGSSNTATRDGGVTTGVDGALTGDGNTAYSFNGTSGYVQAPSSASLNQPSSALTVEAWVKPTTGMFGGQIPVLVKGYTSHSNPYYQYAIFMFDVGGYPKMIDFDFTTGGTLRDVYVNHTGWVYNVWNHIVATYDGSYARIYVNGVQKTAVSVSGTVNSYSTPTVIGGYANVSHTSGNVFAGGIDEVAIYDTALSAETIAEHYAVGSAGETGALLDCPDPIENNSLGSAELLAGTVADRSLCDDETDWYELAVTEGDSVSADLTAADDADLDLTLRDDNGDPIVDSVTDDNPESIRHVATETGSLYLEVSEQGDTSAVYTLTASTGPADACSTEDEASEPNDIRADAVTLGGTPLEGLICDSPDVYALEIASGTETVTIELGEDAGDLDMAIYDDTDGEFLERYDSTGTTESDDLGPGSYDIEIYGYRGASGAYTLAAEVTP